MVDEAGGSCVVVVSWCVVVVDVVSGSDEQAPRPKATEAQTMERRSLIFMLGDEITNRRGGYQCFDEVVVVVSDVSVLLTVVGAERCTTTLLTTG